MNSGPGKGYTKETDSTARSSNTQSEDCMTKENLATLLMEIDTLKNQISNYQAHGLQIQEALMQLHNHMMIHREELTRLGNRMTALEVMVEATDFHVVQEG